MDQIASIDIAALLQKEPFECRELADQIGEAAREIGFFRIRGHGIDADLIEATYRAAQQFFAQDDPTKMRSYIGRNVNHRGYVPFSEKGDYPDEVQRNYEAFDLGHDLPADDPDFLSGNRLLGPNHWPELAGFKRTVSRYLREISGLAMRMTGLLETHLRLPPGAMRSQMSKPVSQLRLLHYLRPPGTREEKSVNMGAHTDYECLTLLHCRNDGLQVMRSDDVWIDVPADPDSFVVNIGDMLEAWSNGAFRSTPHRVVNASQERFSLPYFAAADYDAVIRPFPQLVKPGMTPGYKPFLAGEHLYSMLERDFPYLKQLQDAHLSGQTPQNRFESRIRKGVA